ncbi:MAG: 2-hydroxycarboxylate transporter family protein [Eubacterium sp.]|nr:2-hydroxycarboxylate transporter family protein [Eubacterium sp.]
MQAETKKSGFIHEKIYGMPMWIMLIFVAVIYVGTFTKMLPADDMLSIVAIMFSIGFVFYEIGERLPIWKDYIGGGAVLAFFGAAALEYFKILDPQYSESITFFYDDFGFQTIFISLLITSAVLTVNRKQLIKSFTGYIPAILGGLVAAAIFGLIGAVICGVNPIDSIVYYTLPIMGGGNGSGAIPLSQMWEGAGNGGADAYYSKAFAVLNIANNFAILGAVALNALGEKFPKLTGKGELLRDASKYENVTEEKAEKPKITIQERAGGLMLTCATFTVASILSEVIPPIGLVEIHMYAWLVLICIVLNIADVIPAAIKEGAKEMSSFFTKPLMCMCMCGIGIAFTDLGEFIAAINPATIFIAFMIVLGAIIGSGFVGMLFGFNFVEGAMTSGLCMANRGGSGDLQVLSAGKRLNLMSYAQISSRIGGAIVLVLASVIFGLIK